MTRTFRLEIVCLFAVIFMVFSAGNAQAGTDPDELHQGYEMVAGDYLETFTGNYRFIFQHDGNLVLRAWPSREVAWASGTNGKGGTHLKLQGDGNLVLYTSTRQPVWASGTHGSYANKLMLSAEGTIALYRGIEIVWETENTLDDDNQECLGSRLAATDRLYRGEYICSGACSMGVDDNGNFGVWYDDGVKSDEFWSTGWSLDTAGRGDFLTMQQDGNLVVYDNLRKPVWSSSTADAGDNAELVLYQDGRWCVAEIEDQYGAVVWQERYDD